MNAISKPTRLGPARPTAQYICYSCWAKTGEPVTLTNFQMSLECRGFVSCARCGLQTPPTRIIAPGPRTPAWDLFHDNATGDQAAADLAQARVQGKNVIPGESDRAPH